MSSNLQLKLYDTLTREKRAFVPLDPARVRMYVCGPTVYDFAHIGNARPVIVFDVLFRLLRHIYGADHVTYVRNVTDVDDKINARASERGVSIRDLTEETYNNFKADVAALGCLPPTAEPRATEHIAEMKVLIERLVKAGCAYVAQEHVLFHVASMKDYGRLSNRSLDEMIAGARVEVAPFKKDPMDFVLWKPSKPGEPSWPSPAGITLPGRPGWHIECSAMAWKHLGETFDIHGGGIDLVFPHHENEIAQSRCAFHTPAMANYWMHNGFLQVEGEKMSKSLGNFVTIRELLSEWPGEVIRLNMLKVYYRQPLDWTGRALLESKFELENWKKLHGRLTVGDLKILEEASPGEFFDALFDDLNTPAAIGVVHGYAKSAHKNDSDRMSLLFCLDFLGLDKRLSHLRSEFSALAKKITETFTSSLHVPAIERFIASQREFAQKLALLQANSAVSLLNEQLFSSLTRDVLEPLKEITKNLTQSHVALAPKFAEIAKYGEELQKVADKYGGWDAVWNEFKYYNQEAPFEWRLVDLAQKERINEKIECRLNARVAKNFAESDRIRDELAAMGVVLKDSKDGTTWELAR